MKPRHATRTVLFDHDGQVAIIYVQKYGYYKIPGGGVEAGEDLLSAAKREVLEETGCNSEIIAELGRIETDLAGWDMHDVSDGFAARLVGGKRPPHFEDHETERGFELKWSANLADAIRIFESNNAVADPEAALLQARDLQFLKLAAAQLTKTA